MLYNITKEQLQKLRNLYHLSEFTNAEMLVATFKTNMDVVKEIIPRPLMPAKDALASVFVARYPETNFGCIYNEGALLIHCQYRGEKGLYCLSMPVDDDMAMVSGRENYGYPKKMADKITFTHEGNRILGSIVRKQVEILRIEGQLGNETSVNVFDGLGKSVVDWDGVPSYLVINFLFKYFQSPNGSNFDYFPRLVRQAILFKTQGKTSEGTGKILLSSTPCDPLGEVPVGEIIQMLYGKCTMTMLPGKVVAKIWNPVKFARYAFFKTDFLPVLLSNYDPNLSARAKKIMKIAKKY